MSKNNRMSRNIIYCPECGHCNSQEMGALMMALHKDVYLVECQQCENSFTIIFYESSGESVKE